MTDTSSKRSDVYNAVTDSIIAAISAGAGAFVMPWHTSGAAISRPENALTRMDYHGANVLALWAQSFTMHYPTGFWASYKQWQQLNAQVRRGEKGTPIVFYRQLSEESENSEEDSSERPRPRLFARASWVFNAAQTEGWEPAQPPVVSPAEIRSSVAAFIAGTGAVIRHGADGAWYDLVADEIAMPSPDRFIGTGTSTASEAYQATILHELVHWTGAVHRLDRYPAKFTMEERAREELIAEIGAAFLCADLGVANEPRPDHAAYVAHWLRTLKDDARAVFVAARLASKATELLHDLNA